MAKTKIAITLDSLLLKRIDRLVRSGAFPSRSNAIERAVEEELKRLGRRRLAEESGKLNRRFEQAMAEEGMGVEEHEWPEY